MLLYALCLTTLIQSLVKNLSGIKIGRRQTRTVVTAYAVDVAIYLTQAADIPKMKEILLRYETATGARINMQKSRAMAIGNWHTTLQIMDMPYHKEIKILGFHFSNSVNSAAAETWFSVIACVRAIAQNTYYRNLTFDKRINFVHDYLLAKIWSVTQIFPPSPDKFRQISTTIACFIWQGEIFRVPLFTLQREKIKGGWNLVNISAKCRALFMQHLQVQSQREGSITAEWLKYRELKAGSGNSPYPIGISEKLEYLRVCVIDAAYIRGQMRTESNKTYKKRIYASLRALSIAT